MNERQEDYIPVRGDVVWINFNPQTGNEIQKRRPALVLSPFRFNRRRKFALVCPITSTIGTSQFDVPVPEGLNVCGYVRVDQIKSLDWRSRKGSFADKMPDCIVEEVCDIVDAIIWGE